MPMTSVKLIHCVSFKLISIGQKRYGFFFASHLKPKPSPCVLLHVHTFCDEFFCLFLWSVPQSIDRQYNQILCHHHKRPSQTSLNLPPEQMVFVFSPVHLSSLRCLVKSSFRVHICLKPLHSHRLESASIFLM